MEFTYKGKRLVITQDHPDATVAVDGREFACHHHHEGEGLDIWMCEEAYFASADIKELARHFADYGYLFDNPGRVVVDDAGEVVRLGPKQQGESKGGAGHGAHGAEGEH